MTGKTATRIVLADDHEMVRHALARVLEECEGMEVVGHAAGASEARGAVERLRPDVLVLDYSMPDGDAPAVIEPLLRAQRDLKILVLTIHESIHYAVRALEAGAHGYLIKASAVQELLEAIRAVRRGEVFVSPSLSQRVIQTLRRPRADRVGLEALSPREFEMLRVLGAGMGLGECARHLNISTSTASTYRARLMDKLNLKTTAEVIRFALENGVVG